MNDFEKRLKTATDSYQSGVQAQTLKLTSQALSVGKEALEVGEKTLEVGNENRDTLKLESQWTTSTLV